MTIVIPIPDGSSTGSELRALEDSEDVVHFKQLHEVQDLLLVFLLIAHELLLVLAEGWKIGAKHVLKGVLLKEGGEAVDLLCPWVELRERRLQCLEVVHERL